LLTPPWRLVLGLLFWVHILFGMQRLVWRGLPDRVEAVERYATQGPVRFHLEEFYRESIPVVEFLLDGTPPDAVVLYEGEPRGVIELAVALLHPRLLLEARAAPPEATLVHGRPLARGRLPGVEEGVLVLVCTEQTLELRRR
jgi:hypothetical protein